jgi:hypothetical protein
MWRDSIFENPRTLAAAIANLLAPLVEAAEAHFYRASVKFQPPADTKYTWWIFCSSAQCSVKAAELRLRVVFLCNASDLKSRRCEHRRCKP